jgi:hypothetical protein
MKGRTLNISVIIVLAVVIAAFPILFKSPDFLH